MAPHSSLASSKGTAAYGVSKDTVRYNDDCKYKRAQMPAILNMAAKPKARSGHANAVMQAGGAADNMLSKNRASKARGECGNATSSRGMIFLFLLLLEACEIV